MNLFSPICTEFTTAIRTKQIGLRQESREEEKREDEWRGEEIKKKKNVKRPKGRAANIRSKNDVKPAMDKIKKSH